MNVADLVDEVVDAIPEWDDIRTEAERAAAAVGEWAQDTGKALRKRNDEQTTWFLVGAASVIALIVGITWWRKARLRAAEGTEAAGDGATDADSADDAPSDDASA